MSENQNISSSLHYLKARVILGFLLMGGGLGTWLFLLAFKVHDALVGYGQAVAWQSIGDFVDFVYTVGHIFMGGFVLGFIPAGLCGWWLAENWFCYTGWRSLWLPLVSGLLFPSVIFIWLLPDVLVVAAPCGAFSAVILARILCPKGSNNEAA